jgi:RNA-directed DNA polymerase
MLPSGRKAAQRAAKAGERIPTYNFLGFTCYWGKSSKGHWRLQFTSRQDRFTATLKELRAFLWGHLNVQDTDELLRSVIRKVKGWLNYHAISDNYRRALAFLQGVRRMVFKWFNRRGGKRRMKWEKLTIRLGRVGFPKTFKTISMFA